jgi:D-threonate/D-erythronate kinase
MPIRLGVIADDLTGANDTGVQFAQRGARTVVPLDWHDLAAVGRGADVLVLTTNSRSLPPRAAAQRARLAAEALHKAGVATIYKKIDSTFRGNVGAELDAILEVFPAPLTILTPAFPPAGRAVRDGILTVRGVPVHETAIGRDPVTPIRESHLSRLLSAQLRRPIYTLGLRLVRGAPARAADALRAWRGTSPAVVLADATTPRDLERLAHLIVQQELGQVVAGSAGLAGALSRVLTWERRSRRPQPRAATPVLLVVGSRNPASLAQVAWAERRRAATVIRAVIREIVADQDRYRHEVERVVKKVCAELGAGRHTLLAFAQGASGRPLRPSASATLSEFLGQATRRIATAARPGGLVLCGGDIAIAACAALEADGLELAGEVEAGVPWGRLVGGPFRGLPAVTKAGGFGTPAAFARAIRFLAPSRRGAAD